ncbi:hypothetical protein BU26DRAFT_570261 [Trematosphaeria pertusa]|uniref:Uncharacterized protein n=1 Tax=Trematosphaeria pertusa TaxID=390896 RepID=A0A6A6I086_9PLEO|nr:uncharacterized protein BU26DRAFT_570261 [Trematosphaeria pertusa]KAF2243569.1 hypothetical protein BU26DRAFT_570261 [Trematosphaeria pertusa]
MLLFTVAVGLALAGHVLPAHASEMEDLALRQAPHHKTRFYPKGTRNVSAWTVWTGGNSENHCRANCTLGTESTISTTIEWSGSLGGGIGLKRAIDAGLNFGVAVSVTKSTSTYTEAHCNANNYGCVCGFMYWLPAVESFGKRVEITTFRDFEYDYVVRAPVLGPHGVPDIFWDRCKSSKSSDDCDEYPWSEYLPCPDGV